MSTSEQTSAACSFGRRGVQVRCGPSRHGWGSAETLCGPWPWHCGRTGEGQEGHENPPTSCGPVQGTPDGPISAREPGEDQGAQHLGNEVVAEGAHEEAG